MSRRPANITQADIKRAIRAAKSEGWLAVRVVMPSGVAIEVTSDPVPQQARSAERKEDPVF